ncbi:MAG: hypothetical protein RLZZ381_4150 [Cyanobacteriota bacterium]|jgi:hypothetical protein
MTNNKYFQNLEAISALNALEDEAAATCSGGTPTLYSDANFGGNSFQVSGDQISNLGFFNDATSSLTIDEGTWEFFSDANFQGQRVVLGPGSYSGITETGFPNDSLSSLRRAG